MAFFIVFPASINEAGALFNDYAQWITRVIHKKFQLWV